MQFAAAKFNVSESHDKRPLSASMNAKTLSGITLILLGSCSMAASEPSPQIPLPSDLALPSSAAAVPAEVAAFGGAWGGDAWQGLLPHVLVVERINSDGTVGFIYALGDTRGILKWTRKDGHRLNPVRSKADSPARRHRSNATPRRSASTRAANPSGST